MANDTQAVDFDRASPNRLAAEDLPITAAAEADLLVGNPDRWTDDPTVDPAVRARALVVSNRAGDAVAALGSIDRLGPWSEQSLVAAIWTVSRVSFPSLHGPLKAAVESIADDFVTQGDVPLAPRASLLGMLASAVGQLEESTRFHELAVDEGDRRAPLWGSLARLELARVQITRRLLLHTDGDTCTDGATGRAAQARQLDESARRNLVAAATFFASCGYDHLASVATSMLELDDTAERDRGIAAPTLGYLSAARPLKRDSTWLVGFGVEPPVEVPNRKGLIALAHLVANRHRQVPAVEIDLVIRSSIGGSTALEDKAAASDLIATMDRLKALRATSTPGPDELSRQVREIVFDEKVRSRITKLVRRTVDSLDESNHSLSEHLRSTITTGYTCSYAAPPHVRWVL